jgi:TrmH family RNA methyltransferase
VGAPDEIVVSRAGLENPEVLAILDRHGSAAPTVLANSLFNEISSVATPTGIMAIVKTPRARALPADPGTCVMLEGLQDPGNLGSILRSCAAAGIERVLLSRGSVHAWSPRVLRAGMGAHFRLQIHEEVDVVAAALDFPGTVITTCASACDPLFGADLTGKVALAFGNEGSGLTPSLRAAAHMEVAIPMAGATESLNVAAAVAVCLFERSRQLIAVQNAKR